MIALFRMSPLMSGTVYLDGLDITTVPLQRLRSAIAVIPQVFSMCLRVQLWVRV
jgi:ABC-type multidrug transport system fused ATPase/permease subunit